MTPKDTAIELVDKYRPLVYPYLGSSFMTGTESDAVITQNAKAGALICVDQIIENYEFDVVGLIGLGDGSEISVIEKINYWDEVKSEINKICHESLFC